LVNGGFVFKPLLVRQLASGEGGDPTRFRPEILSKLPFSEEALGVIRDSLEDVVNDKEEGTGTMAHLDHVRVSGKTGTAEAKMFAKKASEEVKTWLKQDHAWFIGYAPSSDPQIVVVSFIEHGGSGGKIAAPVAQFVIDQYFRGGFGLDVGTGRPSVPGADRNWQ